MTKTGEVRNAELLERVFGGWPSFHDAEVLAIRLDRSGPDSPTLEMDVHVFQRTPEVDRKGSYVLKNHTLAKLRFTNVVLEVLRDFNEQNVLWDLVIEKADSTSNEGARLHVHIESSYGVEASFQCGGAEILAADSYGLSGR